MICDIHVSRADVSESTRRYLERRLDFALERFQDSINSINVTLSDINGPRGGVDQQCRLRITLRGDRTPVITKSVQDSLRAAIDVAADSSSRLVARRLDKLQSRRRVVAELHPI